MAHRERDAIVLDAIREWKPPFDPSVVVKEAAETAKSYHCTSITGDNYSGEWCVEAFRQNRITYQRSEWNKSELYLAMIPAVNAKQIQLLEHKRMLEQFRRLERRKGRTGKDSIDHPPRLSDDIANSVAGVASLIAATPVSSGYPTGVHRDRHSRPSFREFGRGSDYSIAAEPEDYIDDDD